MESVSVIIPTYNRASLLRRAIDTVRAATTPDDEIVVIDDGSTDETPRVAAASGGIVRYIRTDNAGAGVARNIGIDAAKHDLIAFADSDDEWLPGRLLQQRPLMATRRDLVFSFTDFGQLFPSGHIEPHWLTHWHGDRRSWAEILGESYACSQLVELPVAVSDVRVHICSLYRLELHANYVNVNTLLVRRSVAGTAFRFGEGLPTYEDWECFARLARVGAAAFLDIDTALQRTHDGPRLTQAGVIKESATRIGIVTRNWACDPTFMSEHGDEVRSVLQRLMKIQARALIASGRKTEARRVIANLDHAIIERAAIHLPSIVLRALLRRPRLVRR